ncbi:MAG: hypothetical protein QGD94_05525, partial [Planctomycetia bacterium]|nr:hypothetical protein [Planctomycetia bacterium]
MKATLNTMAIVVGLALLVANTSCKKGTTPEESTAPEIPAEVWQQIQRLDSPEPGEQVAAARALGEMGEKAAPAVPYLLKTRGDSFPQGGGGFFGGEDVPPSPDEVAMEALIKIGKPAVVHLIT